MPSELSDSPVCGGTYGAGGCGGFGICMTVPSGRCFSSSGWYLSVNGISMSRSPSSVLSRRAEILGYSVRKTTAKDRT